MSLIRCSECRKKVSTKATNCPSCGAPVVRKSETPSSSGGCLIIIIATCLLWIGMEAAQNERNKPRPAVPAGNSPIVISRDLLERPEEFCKVISKTVGFSIVWNKSRNVPGEWVLTPAGPSFEFGRAGKYGRPNLFFYGHGTREHEAYRLTLKLNLNGTPDQEEGKEKLIEYANSLLAIDDQSLPPVLLRLIRSTESVVDANPDQSDAQLLHSETGRDYRIELHYETGRYTALILHLIHHDPAENQEPDEPREVTTKPDPSPEEMRNVGLERSNALLVAQKHVKKQLKSPSTAAFPGIFDDRPEVRSLGSNKDRR